MLSRIAESLFWIGRYLERAEDTSRLLDVHLTLLLEDPVLDEEATSLVLLRVMGIDSETSPDHQTVLRQLGWDEGCPSSMVAAFHGARESASRFLATLERAGLVTLGRGKVTVHDPGRLRNYIH